MSFDGGISGVGASWNAANVAGARANSTPAGAGQLPGGPAAPSNGRNSAFDLQRAFQASIRSASSTVFDLAKIGGFDDARLAQREHDLIARLKVAAATIDRKAPVTGGGGRGGAGTGHGSGTGALDGALGGPRVLGGADAAPAVIGAGDIDSTARELLDVRVQRSTARLSKISGALHAKYPDAARFASASTGTYDPATFKPRTREEAKAFGERMIVDLTEGAAQLELVKNQLDVARFEAEQRGVADDPAVRTLQATYDRQMAYVQKLSTVVDSASGGAVEAAGENALAGDTARTAADASTAEVAAELRASGASQDVLENVVGAQELAVDEGNTPGGSAKLAAVASTTIDAYIRMADTLIAQMREDSKHDREQQRELNKLAEQRHAENVGLERRQQQRHDNERAAQAAAEARHAEHA